MSECADAASSLATAYIRILDGLFTALLGSPRQTRQDDRDTAERQRMRRTLWRLERAYEHAVGEDPQAFLASIEELTDAVGDLTPAVIVWVETIESLVQQTEVMYGPQPGMGKMKLRTVKSALARVLIESHIKVPDAIDFARPLVLEAVGGWTIDAIVLLLNNNDSWVVAPDDAPEPVPASWGLWVWGLISRTLAAIIRPFRPLLSRWALMLVQQSSPLTPEVAALIARLRESGGDPDTLISRVETLIRWLGNNRERVLGVVEVISIGTKEAERFAELPGPAKKAYVRNLVMMFLEDEGLVDPNGIFWRPVESLVDSAIDGVVHIFRKRGIFRLEDAVLTSRA